MRFRVLNLIASAVLTAYNAVLGVWPMAAVNAALVVIDLYFIARLQRDKRQDTAFTYAPADANLIEWFEAEHGQDLAKYHPGFAGRQASAQAAVVFHRDRAIGLVAWRPVDGGAAELLADYVIPAYRDYHPGAYVYSPTGPLRQAGLREIHCDNPKAVVAHYLRRQGFDDTAFDRLQLTFE